MDEITQSTTLVKPSKLPWIILGVITFVLINIAAYVYMKSKPKTYQAVFLDSGQVYFGQLNGDILSHVYFIQMVASSTELVPITSAIHIPTDEMKLNAQHVLFSETLSNSSPIVKTIEGQK